LAVRRERPIREIVETLRGIAKTNWLNKWARWLDQLLDTYDVEDPTEVLGIPDVYDIDKLESVLLEFCSDLTESECLKQIEKMIREKGYRRKVTKEVVESVMDYLKSVEKKPELLYGFPTDIRAEIEKIRARPELDGTKAYEIVFNFLTREGVDPEDAKKIAEEIARTIPKVSPYRRAEVLEDVMTITRLARQRLITEYAKREAKAKEVVEKAGSKINERLVYAIIEEFNTEKKYPTINELRERLIRLGYDVTGLEDIVTTLKLSNMVIERDGRLVVRYLAERIPTTAVLPPITPVEVKPVFKPILTEDPRYYIRSTKGLSPLIADLVRSGYIYGGRVENCINWIGAYDQWFIFIVTDEPIEYRQIQRTVWEVKPPSTTHYFIVVNDKDKLVHVYVCRGR
jgi:hypothetical protein